MVGTPALLIHPKKKYARQHTLQKIPQLLDCELAV
jgi:hypothetical protein